MECYWLSDMENSPAEQLDLVAQARASVADRLVTPWWYHPVLGLMLGGYLVALSIGDIVVTVVAIVLFAGACVVLASAYRRRYGIWITGADAGPAARPWLLALMGVVGVAMTASVLIVRETSLFWPSWCLAAVVVVATTVLGRRCDAALRAQLRAGA